MTQYDSLPERIKHIKDVMKWKQHHIATICGITNSGVSAWERGRVGISTDAANAISSASGFHPEWIKTGHGPMMTRDDNVESYSLSGRTVPLISEVQAGAWKDIASSFQSSDAEDWITPAAKVSSRSFALRVTSDSMTNPNGFPSFPEGVILIVDPSIEAKNSDYVIVTDGSGRVTFKQLRDDGFQRMLVPLNPRWSNMPFPDMGEIVGVVKATQFLL